MLVAENRALRPDEFAGNLGEVAATSGNPASTASSPTCPFCAGNESRTPPAVYEKRDEHGRWQIRVVPNMFPAVMRADATERYSAASASITGQSRTILAPAVGEHEVIIESSRHVYRTSALFVTDVTRRARSLRRPDCAIGANKAPASMG